MSVQSIYVALFGRPADPGGLAYWNQVTNGGKDLSVMLKVLPGLTEYTVRFEGMTNTQVIGTVYKNLFGRAPDAEGLAFFEKALSDGTQSIATIAVNILQGATGEDAADVNNKVDAAQLFTASLDTPEEIAAYNGANAAAIASAFLDKVDANAPATAESIEQAAGQVQSGQLPDDDEDEDDDDDVGGGGAGGGADPQLGSLQNGVLTVNTGVLATVTEQGGSFVISASGFSSLTIASTDDVTSVSIAAGSIVSISAATASALTDDVTAITGAGVLNVTGVSISEAVVNGAKVATSPGLYDLYGLTDAIFVVNGSEAQTIKAIWDILDERYVDNANYYDDDINADFIELGLRYVAYLEAGGEPFTDFTAKVNSSGRDQSMHDNLLGNLNRATIEGRNFDDADEADFLAHINDAYETRLVFSGETNEVGGPTHDSVRAFDYAKGWDRPDYVVKLTDAEVDVAGQKASGELYYGDGNMADGFNIVRHEGAGIELALKAKVRGGDDYDAVITDGVAIYTVDTGVQGVRSWGTPADWNFDFSVVTGLNGSTDDLSDFRLVISIDTDATAGISLVDFTFDASIGAWINGNTGFGGDDTGGASVEQNSVNFGFASILSKLQGYTIGGEGMFDIQLAAYDDAELVGLNKIRIIADDI